MSIFCKVDGTKFEPKESLIYCSFNCAMQDCAHVIQNGCIAIKKRFFWDSHALWSKNASTRRVLYTILNGPLDKTDWLVKNFDECNDYCINIKHFKLWDRREFLANNAQHLRKDGEAVEAKRLKAHSKAMKTKSINKLKNLLTKEDDAKISALVREFVMRLFDQMTEGEAE